MQRKGGEKGLSLVLTSQQILVLPLNVNKGQGKKCLLQLSFIGMTTICKGFLYWMNQKRNKEGRACSPISLLFPGV